ncbi:MAG: fused MFS/spermidine synthase [Polyangiaceae bacterium]|nr:fused MFS/spermidine synthase [Polyangiaceae bacterium]
MYEIVWQRVLFAAYGVNIESVTIIVSLFMFGLGTGSLVGGLLSRRYPERLALLFIVCEASIGLFGLISIPLIQLVASKTLDLSLAGVALAVYGLLCVPTMFMGATLPILVTHLHRQVRHVGRAVGALYFFNTIGSAVACLLTVDLLFVFVGRQAVACVAALLNFAVAAAVALYARGRRQPQGDSEASLEGQAALEDGARIPVPLVLLIACVAGYLSLSVEVLLVRAISFNVQGTPRVFGEVLGLFLLGIALGASKGKRFCVDPNTHPASFLAKSFLLGSLGYYLGSALSAQAAVTGKGASWLLAYVLVVFVAFAYGTILPVVSHFGIPAGKPVGVAMSRIYMANIVGSTLGPILTGFVLLDRFSLEQNVLFVSVLGMTFGAVVALAAPRASGSRELSKIALACAVVTLALHAPLFSGMLERLRFGSGFASTPRFSHVVQNRAGIIAVQPDPKGDIIYGGGSYDGRFNLDPVSDSNGIQRAYMVACLHPAPKDVLEIGLSSGSWAWVLLGHQRVERVTAVEINPGYTQLIERYKDGHHTVVGDPKLTIVVDDGRRWLSRNPGSRFDLIVMNTTYHWRSNITSLVSEEFLRLAKQHLNAGGVLYYNTTGSPDIPHTAAHVFRHVTTFNSMVAASDHPFSLSEREKLDNLGRFQRDGRSVFGSSSELEAIAERLARTPLPDRRDELLRRDSSARISDDNMLTEFKRVHTGLIGGVAYRWYAPELAWGRLWARQLPTR